MTRTEIFLSILITLCVVVMVFGFIPDRWLGNPNLKNMTIPDAPERESQ